jgi:hypothetical protein
MHRYKLKALKKHENPDIPPPEIENHSILPVVGTPKLEI